MEKKKISIIIPAHNEEDYLPKLFKSLKKQEGISKMEFICSISPNTKDKTLDIAKKYGCKITQGGKPATARNRGAKKASFNTLFFIDADTYPKNELFLSKALDEFYSRKLDIAGTLLLPDFNKRGIKKLLYNKIYKFLRYIFVKRENKKNPVMQSGMFFRKKSFIELGGFKEGIFREDSEIAQRAVNKNPPLKFGILKECGYLKNSVRRFEKNNFLKTISKNIYLNLRTEIFGYKSLRGTINYYFKD